MRIRNLLIAMLVGVALFHYTFSAGEEKVQKNTDQVEMIIRGIGFDKISKTPVVLLSDKDRKKVLPIWIGLCEARAIELGLSGEITPRPFTYDLFAALVRTMKAKVERVTIVDLRDQVFYAQVEVSINGDILKIDARPSDALALASRMNAPVYVNKSVLKNAATIEPKVQKRDA